MYPQSFHSISPTDGHIIWEGELTPLTAIEPAYVKARQALTSWSKLSFESRVDYVHRFRDLIKQKSNDLVTLIAQETGKPLWEAKTEVDSVMNKVDLSIHAYYERTSQKQIAYSQANAWVRYKPQGVVAVLGPFNFPAHLPNGHIIPALLAGNTVLFKPSPLTPATAEFLIQCWQAVDLPEGVIQLLQGGVSIANALLDQPIQGVYFTGSYQAGLQIHQRVSSRPEVLLALEMGGNNPLIIDETVNKEAAVYHAILSCFSTAGQRCTCARRVFIPKGKKGDALLSAFIKATQAIQIGPFSSQPEPFMGPVISHQAALDHLKAQEHLKRLGGNSLLPMQLLSANTGFLSAGILDMTAVSGPPDEEIFAPLVQIYRYSSFEEALGLANRTRYGLAASLFSHNEKRYQLFFDTMNAGIINWNRPSTGAISQLPFGGIGRSGNHRASAYFAADYCAYPIASLEVPTLEMPAICLPGLG